MTEYDKICVNDKKVYEKITQLSPNEIVTFE